MADQAVTRPANQVTQHAAGHHGRTSSWIVVTIIVIGFIVGGVAMLIGPTWWVFWLGTGIVVLGSIAGAAIRLFDDWY